jgi:hypothetical protein
MKCKRCWYPKGATVCKRCGLPKKGDFTVVSERVEPPALGPEPPKGFSLPEHSPLGASGAERWMNCPGSVHISKVVREIGAFDEGDPEYRSAGTLAHKVGAHCLDNELDGWQLIGLGGWPGVDPAMTTAVQVYLDYVRSRPAGVRRVEYRMHRPEIHPLFFGTLDCDIDYDIAEGYVAIDRLVLEIIDYKHGAGVVVEVEDNPQIMYYANGKLAEHPEWPDAVRVRLTIVQPNAYHPDGPIRSWDTTVGALRTWLRERLVPAMERAGEAQYKLGEWCRFCPAKLACPAYDDLARKILAGGVCTYAEAQQLKMIIKAVEQEEYKRLMSGLPSTGGKLVMKRVDREWKAQADEVIVAKFGEDAYTKPELRSPAQIEALPGGKILVAEWAFKPEGGLTVAAISDKRSEAKPKQASALFGAAILKAGEGP